MAAFSTLKHMITYDPAVSMIFEAFYFDSPKLQSFLSQKLPQLSDNQAQDQNSLTQLLESTDFFLLYNTLIEIV